MSDNSSIQCRITEQTSTEITVENCREIDVVSTIQDGRLLLSYEGTVLGEVKDKFCGSAPLPATMTLFIADVSSTQEIEAWWTPDGISHWQPFSRGTGGVSQVFNVPPVGERSEFRFRAQVIGTHFVDDPKLLLHTEINC